LFYWFLKFVAIGPIVQLVMRPKAVGTENVPATGCAILASNHLSAADWIFMPLQLRRRVTFLAKQEYFTGTGLKGRVQRLFFAGSGQVPIDRTSASAAEDAIRTGVRILREGKLLGIYPEGTRSPDGRLYRGKIGVARMALEADVPVIPVAMIGTFEVQPPGQVRPNIRRVGIRIGKPLDFRRYAGLEDDRFVLRSMTDEIMYELMMLSGQEYVDTYAAKAKAELSASRETARTAAPASDRRAA
jgi:1-acyl-sn-glycerol-3-phosphate acyltransferase